MSRVVLPHTDHYVKDIEPSPAWGIHSPTGDAGDDYIFIRCACGCLTSITKHTVAPNGEVSPSVFHDWGCGWHVFATLEGYAEHAENTQAG